MLFVSLAQRVRLSGQSRSNRTVQPQALLPVHTGGMTDHGAENGASRGSPAGTLRSLAAHLLPPSASRIHPPLPRRGLRERGLSRAANRSSTSSSRPGAPAPSVRDSRLAGGLLLQLLHALLQLGGAQARDAPNLRFVDVRQSLVRQLVPLFDQPPPRLGAPITSIGRVRECLVASGDPESFDDPTITVVVAEPGTISLAGPAARCTPGPTGAPAERRSGRCGAVTAKWRPRDRY